MVTTGNEAPQKAVNAGIMAMEVYVPRYYVDQTELGKAAGTEEGQWGVG